MTERDDTAPWLSEDENWSISREVVENVRPGMYIYQNGTQAFVKVVACTILRNPDLAFLDTIDGKTVGLPFGESVFVRRPL